MKSTINQLGSILTICLIIMTLLTLIVMQSMQISSLQNVMADDVRDDIEAMSQAETTLRMAEFMLENLIDYQAFDSNRDDGLTVDMYVQAWREVDWMTQAHVTEYGSYIVQYLGSTAVTASNNNHSSDMHNHTIESFKITVRSLSVNNQTVIYLESYFNNSLNKQLQSPLLGRRSWFKSRV